MPGSTKLEREAYEQYAINRHPGGIPNLLNMRNPMGGRMDKFNTMIDDLITKYNLPRY